MLSRGLSPGIGIVEVGIEKTKQTLDAVAMAAVRLYRSGGEFCDVIETKVMGPGAPYLFAIHLDVPSAN
jgi:hypothetical protein